MEQHTAAFPQDLDLCNAVSLVNSLRDYVASLREDFDKFENDAKNMSPSLSGLQVYKVDAPTQGKEKTSG